MPLDGPSATTDRESARGITAFPRAGCRWTSGDLNYLFHRQQVELSRAASATSAPARAVHAQFARLYEEAIEQVTDGMIRFRLTPAVAGSCDATKH